ncbi:peptidase S8/S53 domain-containing protein [Panaeolus papilionaceus]|nr:peptidase S8/S53 domain-containing protein [Panaeolus papilionaceus]
MQFPIYITIILAILPVAIQAMPLNQTSTILLARNTASSDQVLHKIIPTKGKPSGGHIVMVKDGTLKKVLATVRAAGTKSKVQSQYSIIPGFSGVFDPATLKKLQSDPDVLSISEDGYSQLASETSQNTAPWGLARLSSTSSVMPAEVERTAAFQTKIQESLTYTYTYDTSADSGIRLSHHEFGGRAHKGATFGEYEGSHRDDDTFGHGTHVAYDRGVAVGTQTGVAKGAQVYSVKVGNTQRVQNGLVLEGLDWIAAKTRTTGRPSVVLMALASVLDGGIDRYAEYLTGSGVHVVAAAGNDNIDIKNVSPAHLSSVIAVGGTLITDKRTRASNYGAKITVFAPGQGIMSAALTSDTDLIAQSGTSQASAYVAGLVAYLTCLEPGHKITPAAMKNKIISYSLKGVLGGLRTGNRKSDLRRVGAHFGFFYTKFSKFKDVARQSRLHQMQTILVTAAKLQQGML